jgi:primosomal protein N' (replication factor Y)
MRVRVPLHGRNVAGWVIEIGEPSAGLAVNKIRSVIKVLGLGTTTEIIELAHWATLRWSGRIRSFVSASAPSTLIAKVPSPRYLSRGVNYSSPVADQIIQQSGGLVLTSPLANPTSIVSALANNGPVIVVIPTQHRAKLLATSLKVNGFSVASWPQDWASAMGGVDIVVGTRSVVWAPVAKFSTIVVIDEHDDLLQEERSPTWHARDVAIERCNRVRANCCLITPFPSQVARKWAGNRLFEIRPADSQRSWPKIEILDRNKDEGWSTSLISSELINELRDSSRRVVCVHNTKGRARLIACAKCRTILRCENCDAAVNQRDEETLECPRCNTARPVVCQACGSSSCALLKPGVSRLREELQAAANRTVAEVTSVTTEVNQRVNVFVGTEAVLHRVQTADTVVFLDIDAELLAPRYRTSELVGTLIVHAARLVGSSKKTPRILLQTHTPENPLLVGLSTGNLDAYNESEKARRELLKFPPFGSLAEVSGVGTKTFLESMSGSTLVQTMIKDSTHGLIRAENWQMLSDALSNAKRTAKSRISIHVDPPRI